jgi:murein DD-endopeptidase MepM/ murein hydrolase activator NlpD
MPPILEPRRAQRLSRPDSQRWLTIMLVLSHRTFRWSLTRRKLVWILGTTAALWTLGVVGSSYGLWATKRLLSFSQLQRETRDQQAQLKATLDQAKSLEDEVDVLRKQHTELLKLLDPKAPGPNLPPMPGKQETQPPPPPADSATQEKVSRLREALERTSTQAALVRASMEPILKIWATTPSIQPTAGYLSSGFGIRVSPFANNQGEEGILAYHTGLDITNQPNTPIQVTADGEVVEAGWMDRYGNGVIVRHRPGLETLYAHLERIDVKAGQKLNRGDIVGLMGRTGNATGVHLHYEVREQGKPVNPQPYLRLQRQWLSVLTNRS